MSVQFTCPHCGQLLSADSSQIGRPVRCVHCQGGVLVPPALDPPNQLVQDPQLTEQGPDDGNSANGDLAESGSHEVYVRDHELARSDGRPGMGYVELSRMAIYTIGALMAAVAIISFLLGWNFGSELAAHRTMGQAVSPKITGHIRYVTGRGKLAADSEAVVIAFPTKQQPDQKIDPHLLRPDTAPAKVSGATRNVVRALGGDFTRTDRNGGYEIEVASPGEYFLLVISSHRSRAAGLQPTTREVVEIGLFVTRATELLKENDFVWSKQMVTQSRTYDHLFGDE